MTRVLLAAIMATGLVALTSYAGETVTEHESYEKRSQKVEPVPPPRAQERTYEETTRSETQRRPAEVEVEKKTKIEDGKVIQEKETTVETEEDDD